MPIIVAVLGIIIVAMSVAFFTISPKPKTPIVEDVEVNRTEEVEVKRTEAMEVESETIFNPITNTVEPVVVTNDATAVVAELIITGESSYNTPARTPYTIGVSLSLKDNVVTEVVVNHNNGTGPANDHQRRFDTAYRTEVIGKKLDEISLSRVGGASLTSEGFNKAVEIALNQAI